LLDTNVKVDMLEGGISKEYRSERKLARGDQSTWGDIILSRSEADDGVEMLDGDIL